MVNENLGEDEGEGFFSFLSFCAVTTGVQHAAALCVALVIRAQGLRKATSDRHAPFTDAASVTLTC